jgi:PKD repeat protein
MKKIYFLLLVLGFAFFAVGNFTQAQSCTQLSNNSTAILRGQITNTGGEPNMTVWFKWRMKDTAVWFNTPSRNVYVSMTPYNFNETLSGLSSCTTYEYIAVARNSAGTSEGSSVCFQTKCVDPLIVSCSVSPNPVRLNYMAGFTSNVSGGVPPYSYVWSGACSNNSATCITTFNTVGTFTANLTVRDSQGNSRSTQCSVTVQSGLPQVITLPPVETL